MDYVLRLQAHDGYQAKFKEVFGDRFSRILCLPHSGRKGDNPHYHFAFTCDYKKPALRMYLKSHFNLAKGNKHLSLKDWDGDQKALSYMFHEGTEPVLNKGFSEEDIKVLKEIDLSVRREIRKNAPSQIVQDCIEHFNGKPTGDYSIFKWIMLRLRANGDWLPNKYQMERWISRVQASIKDDKDFNFWLDQKFSEWFR